MNIYLDHNIISDIEKGFFSLPPSDEIIWVYSGENLAEIHRSGNDGYIYPLIDVLKDIDARLIEVVLDEQSRTTGEYRIYPSLDPHDVYRNYLESIDVHGDHSVLFHDLIARLHGADNKEQLLSLPDNSEKKIEELLEPLGLYTNEIKDVISQVFLDLRQAVEGNLQEIESLEKTREVFGTHRGRANEAEKHDNPLEALLDKIKGNNTNKLTADQSILFDQTMKQGLDESPIYEGIVVCHESLNYYGYRSDKHLSKVKELPGILSDGRHIAYAAYCQGLLSGDEKFVAKASVIYIYKNIATRIFHTKN